MRLTEILNGIEYTTTEKNIDNVEIGGIEINSKLVKKGDVFVCIVGTQFDGHIFAGNAVAQGARVVIAEKELPDVSVPVIVVKDTKDTLARIAGNFYGNPIKKLKLIGVTGTNGKTTVTYLIKAILDGAGIKTGLIGTNQNIIGDEIQEASRTTPDALELQRIFGDMAKAGCEYVVMEVSSHALEQGRVSGCFFEVGVFTNLTEEHLDFHKSMKNYLKAKMKLFDVSCEKVINIDDESGKIIAKKYKASGFGLEDAEDVKLGTNWVSFSYKGQKMKLCIPGKFSVYNALAAISATLKLGLNLKQIAEGLNMAKGVKGRAEVVETGRDFTVLIDYAHTPDGLENILRAVQGFKVGRIVVLFGCGGDRDPIKRPIMGRIATEMADFSIITSDNPRSEDPNEIIKEILDGVNGPHIVIENRYEAIKYALENAKKYDIIVLAGKGHETYQVLKDKTIHFDEREVVAEILSKME